MSLPEVFLARIPVKKVAFARAWSPAPSRSGCGIDVVQSADHLKVRLQVFQPRHRVVQLKFVGWKPMNLVERRWGST